MEEFYYNIGALLIVGCVNMVLFGLFLVSAGIRIYKREKVVDGSAGFLLYVCAFVFAAFLLALSLFLFYAVSTGDGLWLVLPGIIMLFFSITCFRFFASERKPMHRIVSVGLIAIFIFLLVGAFIGQESYVLPPQTQQSQSLNSVIRSSVDSIIVEFANGTPTQAKLYAYFSNCYGDCNPNSNLSLIGLYPTNANGTLSVEDANALFEKVANLSAKAEQEGSTPHLTVFAVDGVYESMRQDYDFYQDISGYFPKISVYLIRNQSYYNQTPYGLEDGNYVVNTTAGSIWVNSFIGLAYSYSSYFLCIGQQKKCIYVYNCTGNGLCQVNVSSG